MTCLGRLILVRSDILPGLSFFTLILALGSGMIPTRCCADEAILDEIRGHAYFHVSAVRSIRFSFETRDSNGWHSKAEFYGDGNRFRINRQDITGMMIDGNRTPPASFAAAFNGDRYQLRHDSEKILRLETGNANARYTIDTPQIKLYGWLSLPGQQLRWDSILDSNSWVQRFETGTYTGEVKEDERTYQTVDFPQREGVKTPCIFKVYFASDLQYFPMKWIRRVEATNDVAATVEVTRSTNLALHDGVSTVLPLEIRTSITGADKATLPLTSTLSIEEETLAVNEGIATSIFNIDAPQGYQLYDFDDMNRNSLRPNAANAGQDVASLTKSAQSSKLRWLLVGNVCAVVLLALYGVFRRVRRRSR